MIFIALGFIVLGSFLILYSFFIFLQKNPAEHEVPPVSANREQDSVNNSSSITRAEEKPPVVEESSAQIRSIPAQPAQPAFIPSVSQRDEPLHIEKVNEKNEVPVFHGDGDILFQSSSLLYQDQGGRIRYDGSDIDVDETLQSYQKFFRIGEGTITLSRTGISFQSDKELMHFDFQRVEKVVFYQNCTVILPRDSQVAQIFFPDKFSIFRSKFKELMQQGSRE